MLKLILESGYIDNEVLEQLNEEQKQMLFQKMREEQVKKWHIREEEILRKEKTAPPRPATKPKVGFLEGSDGRPWVWVMGEHPNDLPYEELVRRREADREEKEREKVRKEAEELAKQETQDLLAAQPDDSATESKPEASAIARSESYMDFVETESPELKPKVKPAKQLWKKAVENHATLIQKMTEDERKAYERRRADELYENMLRSQEVAKNRAADVVLEIMEHWKRTEEKAKAKEMELIQSIRKAKEKVKMKGLNDDSILGSIPEEKKRELTRKISDRSLGKSISQKVESVTTKVLLRYASFVSKGTKPKTIQHAIEWFQETEAPKGVGREPDGSISLWFHGCINRATAESILYPKPAGMYLVRLSHKVWGYAISVKTHTSVKHYVVDASAPHVYKFIGKHQPEFPTLTNLLYYYRVNPITWRQEVLLLACEQPDEQLLSTKSIFQEKNDDEETTF